MDEKDLGYNRYSIESIVEYAQRLVGNTLRDYVTVEEIADFGRNKGSYGNAVQEYYFHIKPNSDPHPDFKEAHLELKATPVKRNSKGEFVAKERLVFTMIDYREVVNEDFEHSQFLEKARDVLLITYLYDPDKDPLDYTIEAALRWGLPEDDLPQKKETGRLSSTRFVRARRRKSPAATRSTLRLRPRRETRKTAVRSPSPTCRPSQGRGRLRAPT